MNYVEQHAIKFKIRKRGRYIQMRERCITVVGSNEQELVSKGLRHISVSELPIEKVKSSLSQFVSDIESIFDGLEEKIEHYNLDEIELRIALVFVKRKV